jgi:hypothetical protein
MKEYKLNNEERRKLECPHMIIDARAAKRSFR